MVVAEAVEAVVEGVGAASVEVPWEWEVATPDIAIPSPLERRP